MTMKVKVRVGPTGHGTVEVDGKDISRHVQALTFSGSVGEMSALALILINVDVDIEGDAEVERQ